MRVHVAMLTCFAVILGAAASGCGVTGSTPEAAEPPTTSAAGRELIAEGQRVFRFETFGDEQVWTDQLRLHEVVEKTVDPTTALKVGLKVDADVLPPGILDQVDLKNPATTVALLKMNAVVGIQATVDSNNHITQLGVTCALCHSTVDNSVMPGIGRRQDGWPNRDLNVGRRFREASGPWRSGNVLAATGGVMAIVNALAGIMVNDLIAVEAW